MKWNKIFILFVGVCLIQPVSGQKSGKKSDETITINGNVLNKDWQPITGAVLYIDNIRTNNISKSDGSYKIKVSTSAVNLEVRSSEYGTFETVIDGQTKIDFLLNGENSKVLQPGESGKQKGSDNSSNKKEVAKGKKMNTYTNIYQMIRGEVSGVIVSGNSVQIQQGHSFFGSSTPLFVVNGVIVSSIDNISPVEVKSIGVLKGSSAAIYGVRGANGVITITLLNGSEK